MIEIRPTSMEEFKRGDFVRNVGAMTSSVVTANYGGYAIAVETKHITNPAEWIITRPDNSPPPPVQAPSPPAMPVAEFKAGVVKDLAEHVLRCMSVGGEPLLSATLEPAPKPDWAKFDKELRPDPDGVLASAKLRERALSIITGSDTGRQLLMDSCMWKAEQHVFQARVYATGPMLMYDGEGRTSLEAVMRAIESFTKSTS